MTLIDAHGAPLRKPAAAGRGFVGPWNMASEMGYVEEPFAGAWQRGLGAAPENILAFNPVYACMTRIINDVSKIYFRIVERTEDGITRPPAKPTPFSPVLDRPNSYQLFQKKFVEQWMASKLSEGNTYALKARDGRGIVRELYILDPYRVQVLVALGPLVFYRLIGRDDLVPDFEADTIVPASEIIHDRMNCLFHPLVGVPPIRAAVLAARLGIAIQKMGIDFFANNAQPGGIISVPGNISPEKVDEITTTWKEKFGGKNRGKIAVLGSQMEYKQLSVNPDEALLTEQLKMSALQVCSAFHVPPFKVGIGETPTYQNAEVLQQIYLMDCLQTQIEDIEEALRVGLGLPPYYEVEADLSPLLRMDEQTKIKTIVESLKGLRSPNEGRKLVNLPPVRGGDSPMMQQQNWSLEDLANRRDIAALNDRPPAAPPADQSDTGGETDDLGEKAAVYFELAARRYLAGRAAA